MIDSETARNIIILTRDYWQAQMTTPEFARLASGKEIGHRIADDVDEKTTALLASHFTTRRQYGSDSTPMPRSMGDIWLLSNGIYNPINVKAGEADKKGQPNMVSLKKLLRALLLHQIDSYYLLIVKMVLKGDRGLSVYLVDLLDYLDYITSDSGPGQIMLKEAQFYKMMGSAPTPALLTIDAKIGKLFNLLEDADRRLQENRIKDMKTIQKMREIYAAAKDRHIDQSGLHLK